MYALLILPAVAGFFFWATVHELSHVAVRALTTGVHYWGIKPYPHKVRGRWYFARSWCSVGRYPTLEEDILAKLSPVVHRVVAAVMLPFAHHMPDALFWHWVVFWGCGLVDSIVGAIGVSPYSDLAQGSAMLGWSRWILRAFYLTLALSAASVLTVMELLK